MDKNAQDHRSEDLLSLGAAQEEQGANQDSAATSTEPALPSPGGPSQDSGSSNVGQLLNAELALQDANTRLETELALSKAHEGELNAKIEEMGKAMRRFMESQAGEGDFEAELLQDCARLETELASLHKGLAELQAARAANRLSGVDEGGGPGVSTVDPHATLQSMIQEETETKKRAEEAKTQAEHKAKALALESERLQQALATLRSELAGITRERNTLQEALAAKEKAQRETWEDWMANRADELGPEAESQIAELTKTNDQLKARVSYLETARQEAESKQTQARIQLQQDKIMGGIQQDTVVAKQQEAIAVGAQAAAELENLLAENRKLKDALAEAQEELLRLNQAVQPAQEGMHQHTVREEQLEEELCAAMTAAGFADVDKVRQRWETEYKDRKIITEVRNERPTRAIKFVGWREVSVVSQILGTTNTNAHRRRDHHHHLVYQRWHPR